MKTFDLEKITAFAIGVLLTFLMVFAFACNTPNPVLTQEYQDSCSAKRTADSAAFADSLNALDIPVDTQMKIEQVFDSLKK